MFKLTIEENGENRVVEIPSGWHDVSYTYFKENLEPHMDDSVVDDPVKMYGIFLKMLDLDPETTGVWDYMLMMSKLMEWMQEIPEQYEFEIDGIEYKIPSLGKSGMNKTGRPFLSVADWESTNDAMEFLNRHGELDSDKTSDIGLVILAALARGPKELDDDVFAYRLDAFKQCSMDVIMSAAFFLQSAMNLSEIILPHSSKIRAMLKRANLRNFNLDGLYIYCKSRHREHSQSMATAARRWMTSINPNFWNS